MNKFSKTDRAVEISEELRGSCTDLADVLEPGEIDDVELLAIVEDTIYQCDVCGWWVGVDELLSGEGVCENCAW